MTKEETSATDDSISSATKDRAELRSIFFAISFAVEMLGVISAFILSALHIKVTPLYIDALWLNFALCVTLGIGQAGANKLMDMVKKKARKIGM